ncbi:MAG: hypothetical protein LBP86_05985 [Azoarcus sp.]|nr:hypothetical protein [Azoarcus sp.]
MRVVADPAGGMRRSLAARQAADDERPAPVSDAFPRPCARLPAGRGEAHRAGGVIARISTSFESSCARPRPSDEGRKPGAQGFSGFFVSGRAGSSAVRFFFGDFRQLEPG